MHHPRSLRILSPLDASAHEGIDQRARTVPCPRVHHELRGLVHHQEVLVFEDHWDRYIFGCKRLPYKPDFDPFPITRLASRGDLTTTDLHKTLFDHTARRAPAYTKTPRNKLV